jgi:hypothetical protein
MIVKLRLTDTLNGPSQTDPATLTEFDFKVPGCLPPDLQRGPRL